MTFGLIHLTTLVNPVDFKDFDTCIIDYKVMIMHKSKLGKKKNIGCFVITGNRKGILGKSQALVDRCLGYLYSSRLPFVSHKATVLASHPCQLKP